MEIENYVSTVVSPEKKQKKLMMQAPVAQGSGHWFTIQTNKFF